MPEEQRLSLEVERLRTESHWRGLSEYLAMSVAAAMAFHGAHGNTKAIVTRTDYDDALNIAAAGLSRLIPVFTGSRGPERVAVPVNLLLQRFCRGATELRSQDGSVVDHLLVKRLHMVEAVKHIKDAGLPFSFLMLPAESPENEQSAASKPKNDERR